MAALVPSSPRLPSPPPPAEIQLGPKSPSMNPTANRQMQQMEESLAKANSKRRIHPGTKTADFAAGPPLVPLNELDSAFQLQEHLAALHYYHTANNTQPIDRETARIITNPPPGTDRTLWLYELCRFLIAQCNSLIVGFLFDTPPCSAATCPEMRASEWQFLCAVHDTPKSCCAIDYCCHTLDWAANVVTNPKIFPSRFVLSDAHDKNSAVKNLVNVFRRLHRIFAHAWFQHRGVFWSVEGQTGLYVFFKTVCDLYDLLPAENYKLPPEAEGLEIATAQELDSSTDKKPAAILPRGQRGEGDDEHLQPVGRTNTRRHIRSNPSTGSAVTTVMEQDEDESGDVTSKLKDMHISAPESTEEESGVEVPVIVEHSMMDDDNVDTPHPDVQKEPDSLVTGFSEPEVKEIEETGGSDDTGAQKPDDFSPEVEKPVQASKNEEKSTDKQEATQTEDTKPSETKGELHSSLSDTSIHDFAKETTETPSETEASDEKDAKDGKEEK